MLQYIGARYVPIFYVNSVDPTSSEWENNVTYEPMTWVSLPNGHMYISKKEVPTNIGSPVSNPEYWLEAGQYNAYIQTLQDQIDDMKDGTVNGSLQYQINQMNDGSVPGSLQDQINDMNDGNVPGSLQDQINDNAGDITTLQNTVADLQKDIKTRPTLFIGDSYGDQSGEFIERTITSLQMTDATNLAVSGAGFISDGVHTFVSQLQNYTGDRTRIKAIYVCGGLNDSTAAITTGTLLNDAIDTFVSYAAANYPNATLYLVYVGTALDGYPLNYGRTLYYREKCKYIYSKRLDFIYTDISGFIEVDRAMIASDGVHPSTSGSIELSNALIHFMNNSENNPIYPQSSIGITSSGVGSAVDNMFYSIEDGLLNILPVDNFSVRVPQNTVITDSRSEVGTLTSLYFNRPFEITGMFRLDGFNSLSFQNAIMTLRFEEDKLYIYSSTINDNHNGFKTFTGTTSSPAIRLIGSDYHTLGSNYVN